MKDSESETLDGLDRMYRRRFAQAHEYRSALWRVLCADFFQRYVPAGATVLELGAGHCEFINTISARSKIAVDLNPDTRKCAAPGIRVVMSSCTDLHEISRDSVDLVFASNLLEHLSRPDIVSTLREAHRVLKPEGRLMLLQPNVRFCARDYWMFFDHVTPIDDRAILEFLELNGYGIVECRPRFLPYTTQSRYPRWLWLVRIYLRLPLLQSLLGQQSFILVRKMGMTGPASEHVPPT